MRLLGIAIAALGAALLAFAWRMPTTLNEESSRILGLPVTPTVTDTLNIGLLHRQELAFDGGLALLICGAIIFAAGTIVHVIDRPSPEA